MTSTASRTSLRRGGGDGRCTRGATRPRAQVTATGSVEKCESSACRGELTWQLETTVAVTTSGADADCACARAGTPARSAAATIDRIASILPRWRLRARENDPDVGAHIPRAALIVAEQRGDFEPGFLQPLRHLRD